MSTKEELAAERAAVLEELKRVEEEVKRSDGNLKRSDEELKRLKRTAEEKQVRTTTLSEIAQESFETCSDIPSLTKPLRENLVSLSSKSRHRKKGTKRVPAVFGRPERPHMHLYQLGQAEFIKGMPLRDFATMKDAENNCTVLLGPSGCGKTRKIYEYLHSQYGYFLLCKFANDKNDGSGALGAIIEALLRDQSVDWSERNPDASLFALRRERAEFAIRCVLVAYAIVFNKCSDEATARTTQYPHQWLFLQLFPVQYFGTDIFTKIALRLYSECVVSDVQGFKAFPRGFACFIDEAQVLGKTLPDAFLTTRLGASERRPLISAILSGLRKTLSRYPVISGTDLTLLSEWPSVVASLGCENTRFVFTDFPMLGKSEVETLLRTFLESSDQEVERASRWLFGRPRLATEFIAGAIEKNISISDYLPEYISRLTGKETSGPEPFTFADSFNLLLKASSTSALLSGTPSSFVEVVADRGATLKLKDESTPNPFYAALIDAFLLSAGSRFVPHMSPALLQRGLGFLDKTDKTTAHITYEPLLLEAALRLVHKDLDSFVKEFLRSVSDDHSRLGERFELIAALKFADFVRGEAFCAQLRAFGSPWKELSIKSWIGIGREYGRIATLVTESAEFYREFSAKEFSILFPDAKAGPDAMCSSWQKWLAKALW